MRRACRVVGALVAAGAAVVCGDGPTGPTGPAPITSVVIAPAGATADALGDTVQFAATVKDSTGATRTDVVVSWNSSAPDVMRSLGQGKFLAEGEGTALVIGRVATVADTVSVTVTQVVTSVTLSAPDTNVRLGQTLGLTAVARDGRGNPVPTTFVWSVSDPALASVNGSGVVSGENPGPFYARVAVAALMDSVRLRTVTTYLAVDAGADAGAWQCALDTDGVVLCWGFQLLPYWGTYRYLPMVIQPGPFASVGAGTYFACGLDGSAMAWCWGDNGSRQLGNASAGAGSATPVPVDGDHVFLSPLSVGPLKTCGVRTDGAGICWGYTYGGQLGRDTTGDDGSPGEVEGGHVWRAISARSILGACGVTQSDSLFCWGDNQWGILGDTVPAQSSTPVALRPDLAFSDVAVGVGPIACAITVAGAVYCWGSSTNGIPTEVSLPGPSFAVTAGDHACAIVSGGEAYCWGGTLLGDGTADFSATPKQVIGGYAFVSLTQGPGRTCGYAFDGRVYCWGNWTGDGTSEVRLSPVLVAGQP